MWNGPGGTLFVLVPTLPVPGPGEAHVQEVAVRQRRVHCADIQLTFKHDFLGGQDVSRLTRTRVSVVVLCLAPTLCMHLSRAKRGGALRGSCWCRTF